MTTHLYICVSRKDVSKEQKLLIGAKAADDDDE